MEFVCVFKDTMLINIFNLKFPTADFESGNNCKLCSSCDYLLTWQYNNHHNLK